MGTAHVVAMAKLDVKHVPLTFSDSDLSLVINALVYPRM